MAPTFSAPSGADLSDTLRMDPGELAALEASAQFPNPSSIPAPFSGSSPSSRTMLGVAPPSISRGGAGQGISGGGVAASGQGISSTQVVGPPASFGNRPAGLGGLSPVAPAPSQSTLLGVARPGIAPLRPGVSKTPLDDAYEPADELGATFHNNQRAQLPPPQRIEVLAQRDARLKRLDRAVRIQAPLQRQAPKPASRRGIYVIMAAAGLAIFAVAFAFLWPSTPPLSVQVRAADGGAEVLDVRCPSCPDGTILLLGDAVGKVTGKKATIPLATPLAIGDTALKIKVDRPERGRDETVSVTARIAYRIRPDLTMLEADRPAIQIVVEAMGGSKVSLDGDEIPMRDGRAIRTIDVSKDLEGSSPSSDTLVRKVTYTVTPPGGSEEKGMVTVNATVLPLVIDAPGPGIVTDQSTFVLAGKTLPGAEISAAGRGLEVAPDGSFARTMNVSSVGATQIEVRAKMPGKAPRFARINVERVASLDSAAVEFSAKKPIGYAELAAQPETKGKPVSLDGVVAEVRPVANGSLVVLHAKNGCARGKDCPVRLSLGFRVSLKRDDKLRIFGTSSGAVADGASSIPSVDVAFILGAASTTTGDGARPSGAQ